MDKFGRRYVLSVQKAGSEEFLEVRLPLTIEFDVVRNNLTSANDINIRIYNLSEISRNSILRDQYNYNVRDRKIALKAGYGESENFPLIFSGFVVKCTSFREHNNFITHIVAHDGGDAYVNATVNKFYPNGTRRQDVIVDLISTLAAWGVAPGTVGVYDGVFDRGYAASGNTIDRLNELTGGSFYIDNGRGNALGYSEVLSSPVTPVISAESGLLGTPKREESMLIFEMLFEPSLSIDQLITLNSVTAPQYNQDYKIISIHHRATISDAICGEAITTVGMFYREQFTPIQPLVTAGAP